MTRTAVFAGFCVIMLSACQAQTTRPSSESSWWELDDGNPPPTTEIPLPLFNGHPRLMFRPADDVGLGRSFEHVRQLYAKDATFKAIFDKALAAPIERQDPAMLAALWIVTGRDEFATAAVNRMVAEKLNKSGEPYYSNVYIHGLAYDWLYHHPAMTVEKKKLITDKMIERIKTELDDLDADGMAAWHGRNQAANGTMIAALAVGDLPGCEALLRRAAAHYISSLRDLQFSEGWPEGASYWIYNRAGPYPMAADCVMTALGSDKIAGLPIRDIMRTIGLWSIYQYAPNGVFEFYGDGGGSLQLGQTGWWELSVDHYAKLSRDPGVAAGGDYLRNRSPDAYGKRPYHWRIVYTYEPAARPKDNYDPARPELWMRKHLPQAMLFGRDSYGVAFFRGEWGDPNETYATFKAGDLLAHHDHYDTGHFGIQRGGDLTPRTGVYGFYSGPHRLGYFIQSVSKNTLLVMIPGESSDYLKHRYPQSWTSLSGGQRIIRPTSFNCVSMDHFKRQLNAGPHLERATINAFDSRPGAYDYVSADITAAYNSTLFTEPGNVAKVSRVTRQLVYLRPEQAFVVFDRVETSDSKFLPKFLLHSHSKPQTDSEKLLLASLSTTQPDLFSRDTEPPQAAQGSASPQSPTTQPDSGIYETFDRTIVTQRDRGRLTQLVLLPAEARVLKIGGPKFCYYVESDGDQSDGFDGVNLLAGAGRNPNSVGRAVDQWRVEVEPTEPAKSTRFLNVLLPRLTDDQSALPRVELVRCSSEQAVAVRVGRTVVVFARERELPDDFTVEVSGKLNWLLVDLPRSKPLSLHGSDSVLLPDNRNKEGVVYKPDFELRAVRPGFGAAGR